MRLLLPLTLFTALPLAADSHEACSADAFMDVSDTAGPGDGYDRPRLEVHCDDNDLVVSTNSIPHYEFVQITRAPLVPREAEYRIPLQPSLADEPTTLPLLGGIGVAINGVPIFGPNEGAQPPPGWGDPIYNAILDSCMGHTAREYHYHALVQACFDATVANSGASPILAFAWDGFPVYGPAGCADADCSEVIQFRSSWDQVADPRHNAWEAYQYQPKEGAEYLDQCNGHAGADHGGRYHYHATENFPYIMGCFAGTLPAWAALPGGGGRPPGGGTPVRGGTPVGGPAVTDTQGTPQTTLRSVRNAMTMERSPASVSAGGILSILGEGFVQQEAVPTELPLPTSLGDPALQVLVNDVAAPLYLVSPGQVNAQVPWSTEPGSARVVVRRADSESLAMSVAVESAHVNFLRHEDSARVLWESNGVIDSNAALTPESIVTLFATGLGPTEPPLQDGSAAVPGVDYVLQYPQAAFLNGLPAPASLGAPSPTQVGVFELQFTVPREAAPTGILRWLSGDTGGSAVLGPVGAAMPRYLAVDDRASGAIRIDMTDLSPDLVALTPEINPDMGCYAGALLLDFRRREVTELQDCLLPTLPDASEQRERSRAFEPVADSAILAALPMPVVRPANGVTDQILLINGETDSTEIIEIEGGVSGMESALTAGSRMLRIHQTTETSETGRFLGVDLQGTRQIQGPLPGPLPDPIEVQGRTKRIAQSHGDIRGYRLEFLGAPTEADASPPIAALFGPSGSLVATADFPAGWLPIIPPRRLSPSGAPDGVEPLAPAMTGFDGRDEVYVVARKADGSGDGIAAFTFEAPTTDPNASAGAVPLEAPSIAAATIEFPQGAYVANCTAQVTWQRAALARRLVIAGSRDSASDYAEPRDGAICASDRVLVFDPEMRTVEEVMTPPRTLLDVAIQGAAADYIYFGDANRAVAFEPSQRLHVFDSAISEFSTIDLPAGRQGAAAGIPYDNALTHSVSDGDSRIVGIATSGEPRAEAGGILIEPLAGNEGLVVVDLASGSASLLPLPEGFTRIIPGTGAMIDEGRPLFGVSPITGRAWALAQPSAIADSRASILTWNAGTGLATEVELPPGGISAARPASGHQWESGERFLWDYQQEAGTFAFGVYAEGGRLMSIGVVGP